MKKQLIRESKRFNSEEYDQVKEENWLDVNVKYKTIKLDSNLKYRGPLKANVPHTGPGEVGILKWTDTKDMYKGEFKQGKRHG